jgi:hypothetical protein
MGRSASSGAWGDFMVGSVRRPGARLAVRAGLCAAALGAATVAAAAPTPFPSCDGYPAPNRHADNMTMQGGWLGHFAGSDSDTHGQDVGAVGIEACSAALEDPALLPAYWMRRVNLLRARAIHRLAEGDAAGALADIDLAEAAVRPDADIYYRRSLGVDLKVVRAYALALQGDRPKAEAMAMEAFRLRPYSPEVGLGVVLATSFGRLSPEERVVWRRLGQLRPRVIDPEFSRFALDPPPVALGAFAVAPPPIEIPPIPAKPVLSAERLKINARNLFNSLPDAETLDEAPVYREAKRPLLAMHNSIADYSVEGYRVYDHAEQGYMTVEFRARQATPAMVEEAALLKAADLTLAAGKRGFIVTGAKEIHLGLNNVYYGTVVSTGLLNRQALLDVVFVDPDHLPAQYATASWRVLDAQEIRTALSPYYPPAPTTPTTR